MALEKQKLVLGDLLNRADHLAKKVISAYTPGNSYKSNHLNIKKFDSAHQEAAATFLGFAVRGENEKKLYKNLSTLSDRILLKIESFFEIDCRECNEKYSNSIEDQPPLTCRLCLQGSHSCQKILEKVDAYKEIPEALLLVGMTWLCSECFKKNDLALVSDEVTIHSDAITPHQEPTEDVTEVNADRESPRRQVNNAVPIERSSVVCEAYKKRNCPHGLTGKRLVDGKPCPKSHPPRCFRYCKHGDNARLGCTKGNDCKYFHPKLCRDSVKKRVCLRKDCTFLHLKNTRRNPSPTEPEESEMPKNRQKQKIRFDSLASLSTPYPPTVQRRFSAKEVPNHVGDSENSFLLQLIENLKEGIINQVTDKLVEFQSTIPVLIKEQMKLCIPVQNQLNPPAQNQMNFPMSYAQMAQNHLMQPSVHPVNYPVCSL